MKNNTLGKKGLIFWALFTSVCNSETYCENSHLHTNTHARTHILHGHTYTYTHIKTLMKITDIKLTSCKTVTLSSKGEVHLFMNLSAISSVENSQANANSSSLLPADASFGRLANTLDKYPLSCKPRFTYTHCSSVRTLKRD